MKKVLFKILGSIFLCLVLIFTSFPNSISASSSSDNGNGTFNNPVIYADVPDCSVIRVGSNYYMVSTTMHLSPGVPIMKSTDLVNWEIVNYVYDTIGNNDAANLVNGSNMYGKGSWAASLKYHAGTYYCSFMSYTTGKTYLYQTKDIEDGTWTKYEINGCYHDMSLLFDTDGKVYMLYGGTDIKYIELNATCTGIKSGGASGTLFSGKSLVGDSLFEGTQVIKQNGYYYVFNIAWPSGKPRTQYCSRSKSLNGPWEHKIVLQTNFDNVAGVAQGGIVDTVDGKWYGLLFQDHGPVGRVPVLVPVTWQNDWPIMGNNGTSVSKTMTKPNSESEVKTIVKSDEFNGTSNSKKWKNGLDLVWQWNHNPDNNNWSLSERIGYLRLKTGSKANVLTSAKNTLTQRTYGPTCSGKVALDVTNMKNGDVAGLAAFSYCYGYVGVKMENGAKKLVMVNAQNDSNPTEVATVSISTNKVYLKIDFNFTTNKANFYYSTDSKTWKQIGNTLGMSYSLKHFMGYRFGLFNYATQQTGGYVDFDYFRVSDELKGACVESETEVETPIAPVVSTEPVPIVSASPEASNGIHYDYKVVSDWGSSFQGELVITNNSSITYNGWTLTCDYNSTITNLWGAELVGQDGTKVTIKNASWESSFAPGATVTINFIATLGSDSASPRNISFS